MKPMCASLSNFLAYSISIDCIIQFKVSKWVNNQNGSKLCEDYIIVKNFMQFERTL